MNHLRTTLAALLALLLSACARADVDAEQIGLVPDSVRAANANTEALTRYLNATLTRDKLTIRGREFFFEGTATGPRKSGNVQLSGMCGRGWPRPTGDTALAGARTVFTQTDGKSPILTLNGDGCVIEGIEFRSRVWDYSVDEGPISGTRAKCGIELSSTPPPAAGLLTVRNCTFTDFESGIRATGGNNADNSTIENCVFFNCDNCLSLEGPQAVCWSLRDITVGGWGGRGFRPVTVVNAPLGGKVTINGLSLNNPRATLFQLGTPSPNTNRFTCRDLWWDQGVPTSANRLVLVKYAGEASDIRNKKVSVWVDGHANNMHLPTSPALKLIDAPAGFPTNDIRWDLTNVGAK